MAKDKENEKKAFAARLNKALDLYGIVAKHQGRSYIVAEMFRLSQRGAACWINGEVYPPKSRRKEIAKKLDVNYDWLEFARGEPTIHCSQAPGVKNLPVLNLIEAVDYTNVIAGFKGQRIFIDAPVSNEAFIVRSTGKAMAGQFPEGTLLVVDPKAVPIHGDYVIAKIKKIPEALFRQLNRGATSSYLTALNPNFCSINLTKDDEIIGVVVEAKMNFRHSE